MTNRGAWTNTPTSSGKVTIPAGYHNGSGYVDTSKVYNAGVSAGATSLPVLNTNTITTKTNTYIFYNNGWTYLDYVLTYNADHSSVTLYANNSPVAGGTKIAGTTYDLSSETINNTYNIKNYKYVIVVGAQYYGYDHSSYASLIFRN